METSQKIKIMFISSMASAFLIALFWTVWYSIAGQVPEATSVGFAKKWTIEFPFHISRWWDILAGPIWSVALVVLFASKNKYPKNYNDLVFVNDLVFILILNTILGLVLGVTFKSDLTSCLIISLISGLAFGLGTSFGAGLSFGISAGLGLSLGFSLGANLVFGLIFGICFSSGFVLSLGLGGLYRLLPKILFSLYKKSPKLLDRRRARNNQT